MFGGQFKILRELLKRSLTAKIVVAIGTSLIVMAILGFVFFDNFLRGQIEKSVMNFTSGVGSVIVAGLERSMMENDQESISLMLKNLSHQENILRAEIINNQNIVAFSTKQSEVSKKRDISSNECQVCHQLAPDKRPRSAKITLDNGTTVIRNATPIYKKPECGECHFEDKRVLGMLILDVDASEMQAQQRLQRMVALGGGGFMGLALIIIITYLMTRLVTRPLSKLSEIAGRVGKGELVSLPPTDREDIIGTLHSSMGEMVSNLKSIATRIIHASERVNSASTEMLRFSKEIKQGATLEKEAMAETATSTQQINNTLKNILKNIGALSSSSAETSSTINEMDASIDLIGESVSELTGSIETTASGINQLASSTSQVASNVMSLSESAINTAEVIEEVNQAISTATEKANETMELSEDVIKNAEQGALAVQKSIDGINRIQASSKDAVEVIGRLGKKTKEIGSILTVIADVSEQTNLLALNAAIIAAQAGVHGRGFGVVAGEIKKLAERTGKSAKMIADLIKSVQSESKSAVEAMEEGYKDVQAGVELTRKGGESLEHILESAKRSTENVREISQAMAQQSKEIAEITKAATSTATVVKQISHATNEQSRSNQQIVKACEEMSRIANHVQRASQEQNAGSKLITRSVENINEMITQIELSVGDLSSGNEDVAASMSDINELATKFEAHVTELEELANSLSDEGIALKEAVEKFQL